MPVDQPWWQVFFDHADSLILSRFPDPEETREQVAALQRLVPLRREDAIADICCGMGRHLLPLHAEGYQLVGLDFSPMMLRLAQEGWSAGSAAREQKARAGKPALQLVQGAAQALPFADGAFDVILNLFNSFGYLPTDGENQQVLSEAARCLKPGGRFFLDTRNSTHQILYAPYREVVRVGRRHEYVMRCTYDRQSRRLDSHWYDAHDQTRRVHHASIRLYGLEELSAMLEEAGFEVVAQYGAYDGHDFEGWERELLLLCHRRS